MDAQPIGAWHEAYEQAMLRARANADTANRNWERANAGWALARQLLEALEKEHGHEDAWRDPLNAAWLQIHEDEAAAGTS